MIFSRRSRHILILTAISAIHLNVSSASSPADVNLEHLNLARKEYAKGNLENSITLYNKIEKQSDFWADSVEEKAWAYTRQNNYNKALAELKSIINPLFIDTVNPEAIMLSAFIDLKICNYKGVAEKIPLFKKEMLARVDALEAIVKNPKSEFVTQWIQKAIAKPLTLADLGKDLAKLPRYFFRNKNVLKNPKKIKDLAQHDLSEISKNLKKMKIIEIELIQRTQVSDVKLAEKKDLKFDVKATKDALIFPVREGSKEIWLDELGKFDVQTNGCPQSAAAKAGSI